ncbi:hypothetical protein A8990_11374 [Paenibacillus taihuensis]|uniref:Uncharacterized protein n=1 Tax=Paenibacillus taihuensis TaxID=1156355 RepID=A0A3D9S7A1_9BACL|nr:hypothetical protein A8990_11374 [Paenibacillus taihuensis]
MTFLGNKAAETRQPCFSYTIGGLRVQLNFIGDISGNKEFPHVVRVRRYNIREQISGIENT